MTELEEKEIALAKEYLAYWQPQLRLDHFDFELFLMPPGENNERLANCNFAPAHHRQKIGLRNPVDRTERDRDILRFDLETSLVHELLHTKEFPWRDHPTVEKVLDGDKWLKKLHEDSLDAVAEALVRVRRGLIRTLTKVVSPEVDYGG
jgi:hypothetical protein